MVVVNIFRVVIVVTRRHHLWLINPSAEVARLVCSTLSCSKSAYWVSVIPKWVLSGKEFRVYLGIALGHKVLINKTSALASVTRNVLLSDFVGRTANPVYGVLAMVTVHIRVDVLTCR